MDYNDLIISMKRYGSTEDDICAYVLGIKPEQVQENVIIAPWWEPSVFSGLGSSEYISKTETSSIKIWNISNDITRITYIKTGIGAPVLMDTLLSLGVTPCKKVVFIGSVGALDESIGIGDIVIPEYSVCGDGASRYISFDSLKYGDNFGEKVFPDSKFLKRAKNITELVCKKSNVKWHIGKTFSTDSIFAEFTHIDEILNIGCNVIEMETSSAFKAAHLMGIPLIALLSVSDNTVVNKSLISGRSKQEIDYANFVTCKLFPKIIHELFKK